MEEEKKVTDNSNQNRRDYYVEMAKNPRARVILASTSDTYMMADISRQGDMIISRMRDGMMKTISIPEFTEYMDAYYDIIFKLEAHLKRGGKMVGIDYRMSRTSKAVIKQREQISIEDGA
jgi:hypothetical protein